MLTLDQVREEALLLGESDRARLAEALLLSLPHDLLDEEDELAEAERRDAEMDADPSMVITWEQLSAAVGR